MRQPCLLYNPKNILYRWRTQQEGCASTSQGPVACVVWHALSCLKGNEQQLPGKAQIQPRSFVLRPGTHKALVTQLDLQHLGWEQDLPLHSLTPVKFILPEFPCSQVPGSIHACCEECLLALLEMKCTKQWMKTFNFGHGFLIVGRCCALCTQVPKLMVNGCSHQGRGRSSYRHWQSHPWLLMERGAIPIFHLVSLPAPPSHLTFPQLLSSMKWW